MHTCPRCGTQTEQNICPICFTQIVPNYGQNPAQPPIRWAPISEEEAKKLPPFICPKCGSKVLLRAGNQYCCGGCNLIVTLPAGYMPQNPHPEQPMQANAQQQNPQPEQPMQANAPQPQNPQQQNAQPNGQMPPQMQYTAPQQAAAPAKPKKKGYGILIGVLAGFLAFYLVGTIVAIAVGNGIVKNEKPYWQDYVETNPFEDIPGFGENPFGDIFGDDNSNPFAGNNDSSTPSESLPDDTEEEKDKDVPYPNGCSLREYRKLTAGMNYAQISAIIGGDAGDWYDTTDGEGRNCTVFQWVTEDGNGYIAVEMIDGKAVDFYQEGLE